MEIQEQATQNFQSHLAENAYPGRGIIIGKNDLDEWVQVYWIMGRSDNSRNRVFCYENKVLRTEAADPSKVEDPSLIIYNAMRQFDGCFIVSNGTHTDTIYEGLRSGMSLAESLASEVHEPDAPNYTTRISGVLQLTGAQPSMQLSLIKKSPFHQDHSEYQYFQYDHVEQGYGYGITTYLEDGNPIPAFVGTPKLLPLQGNAQRIADTYWNALDTDNRISLAVKTIPQDQKNPSVTLLNRY